MADKTGIEWTDATWNPVVGCQIVSPGCTNCYAMKQAHRIEAMQPFGHYHATTKVVNGKPVWTGLFREAPHDLMQRPLRWKRPRRIFVNSMSDLFGEGVTDGTIDRVFAVMAMSPQHTFQILTKRPERMRDYIRRRDANPATILEAMDETSPRGSNWFATWPLPNVWLGVSVEDQKRADERIPILLDTPAAARWISAEPLLGPVDLMDIAWPSNRPKFPETDDISDARSALHTIKGSRLDWVVVGGESGPGARPMHPGWARSLRDQCKVAGVAFLFKQWGNWADINQSPAADEAGWQGRGKWMILDRHGDLDIPDHRWPDEEAGEVAVIDIGKKRAGRLLDGVEHNEYPQTR